MSKEEEARMKGQVISYPPDFFYTPSYAKYQRKVCFHYIMTLDYSIIEFANFYQEGSVYIRPRKKICLFIKKKLEYKGKRWKNGEKG